MLPREIRLLAAIAGAWLAPGLACAEDAPATAHARWINAPHSNEMVWPGFAFMAHISGHVHLDCTIDAKGKLKPCVVLEDTPKGQGFADAAIAFLAPTSMRPPTVDGAPVPDAHVDIVIDFDGARGGVRFAWRSQ
jgi:TonB family protein